MYARELEKYPTVVRWINKVIGSGTESSQTKELYLHFLNRYSNFLKMNPDQIIAEHRVNVKSDEEVQQRLHEEKLLAFESYLEKKGKLARSSINTAHNIIKSFYSANYADLKAQPLKTWAATRRSVPTPDQLRGMVESAESYRDKAVIMFLAQTGLGVEDFQAITYGQIKDEFEQDVEPLHIHLVREKTKTEHDTFLGKDGLLYLKLYLAQTEPKKNDLIFNLTARTVEYIVRGASERAGIDPHVTPHKLRSFFKTYLTLNKVPVEIVEYWMGHRVAYSGAYLVPPVDTTGDVPSQRKLYRENEWILSILKEEKKQTKRKRK